MNKSAVIRRIIKTAVIPVIRAGSADDARRLIELIIEGGIDIVEVTMTVPDAPDLIRSLSDAYSETAVIGAGTVLDSETAKKCIDSGSQFIVSPATDLKTIEYCNDNDIVVMPGGLTPTEVLTAWEAGADFVKIFPASSMGGAPYLKALKAPLPHVNLIPTGGVSFSTAADYLKAGASAFGVGSDLVDVSALKDGRQNEIIENSKRYLEIVKNARRS
ncbi:MAG: bifunctional 4-hydroxy-2-oxoglutarate aldolase/2-dehydro-3-deoxy-phosphogluconate aldolase [Acidobacteria bacterium]|nr:bifunctional 4-hydroxy-2-oxoglutarate aldolase/2-dehydro-3-deoxy-phosphogluconate aldolase [Acidobacteriota bacterium]